MLKTFLLLGFLCGIITCSNNKTITNSKTKTLDFKEFTIEAPITWEIIQFKGRDSYVGGIQIDSSHTASFDLGKYSSDLSNFVKEDLKDTSFDNVITGEFPPPNADSSWLRRIKKCVMKWDTIDGRTAKIIIPINSEFGVTGVYFDSLWVDKDMDKIRLQISGNNLDSNNEKLLLQAFKTLKFKQPK